MAHNASDLKRVEATEFPVADLAGRAGHSVTTAFADVVLQVRFSDAETAEFYRSRYRHMLSDASPQLVAYVVARGPEETYFWVEGDAAFRWDHCRLWPNEAAFLTDAVVTTSVFSSRSAATLHAAAVSNGDAAAAILGASCAGKTTTAIACARRGLKLYSDEFCILGSRGIVPFPRTFNLRGEGVALLAGDRAPASFVDAWLAANAGTDREDVGWDELFGRLDLPEPRSLGVLFAIVGAGADAIARPVTSARMLGHVSPWVKTKARGVDAARRILELMQNVALFELTLGTPDATAQVVEEQLAAVGCASFDCARYARSAQDDISSAV